MKKIIATILFIFVIVGVNAQEYKDFGGVARWLYISPEIDSADTFTSAVFPAYDLIGSYAQLPIDTGEVDSDTKFVSYTPFPPYAIVQVKGGGTVDSLSTCYLQGKTPSDTWVTIDTLATAKEVSCMTYISYNEFAHFTELRCIGTVANLTVSAYDVRVYIEIVISKANRGTR